MRTLTITSMLIQPDIYRLIDQCVKTHEVRDEPFHPDVIIYRSTVGGTVLGVWRADPDSMRSLERDQDDDTIRLAAIDSHLFYELFPDQPVLYVVSMERETSWRQVETMLFDAG